MKFDFYLSEMSVADNHGGGLTLQRILGDDLKAIDHFFHVNRFAADHPAKEEFKARVLAVQSIWEGDTIRKVIGRTLSHKLAASLPSIKLHAKRAARKIAGRLNDKALVTGLICPQGANAIFTLEALKSIKQVKYITWVMDDHLLEYKYGRWQYPDGMEQVFAKHLREAEHVFVISPAMQDFYKERFGVHSTVLFGSANVAAGVGDTVNKPGESLKIGYFGAVAAWQLDAIKAVVQALDGTGIQLDIFSGVERLPEDLVTANVNFKGSIKPEMVLSAMKSYDAVLLPISFKQKIRNMSQFNIATKMSEYLACGVPVLAVGPPYAAMIKYLNDNNAAITVSSRQEGDIRDAFKLLCNPQLISGILQNAQKLVTDEVGAQPMRNRWLSVAGR